MRVWKGGKKNYIIFGHNTYKSFFFFCDQRRTSNLSVVIYYKKTTAATNETRFPDRKLSRIIITIRTPCVHHVEEKKNCI